MVVPTQGVYMECSDASVRAFVEFLNSKKYPGKIIIKKLKDNALFIHADAFEIVQKEIEIMLEENSFKYVK